MTPLASLRQPRRGGFTCIGFGAESMNQTELDSAGRPGSPFNTKEVIVAACDAGFENIKT